MPGKIEGSYFDLESFDSPLSVYGIDSDEYNTVKNTLEDIMRLFQNGIKGKDMQYISTLYQKKDPQGKKLIDTLAEPVLNAGIGLEKDRRPTVKEVMDLANNIKIVEADGTVVSYAEKFFDNETIDVLIQNENNSKSGFPAFGSLMAIHIGLFLGMKDYKELDSFATAFAGKQDANSKDFGVPKENQMFGTLIPGFSRVDEPPRVFITVPGNRLKAVVGSNLIDSVEDIKDANKIEGKLNEFDRKIAKANSNLIKWKADVVTLKNGLQRREQEYEDGMAKLELAQKNGQDYYNNFKHEFNEAEAEKIRKKMAEAEEKKYTDFEEKYISQTYNPKREQITSNIAIKEHTLESHKDSEPTVPPEPTEGWFRRFLMFFGAGHSDRYRHEEAIRMNAIDNHNMWKATKESLENDVEKLHNDMNTLETDKEKALSDKRKEIDDAKANLPSTEKIFEEEEKKKREEYIEKPAKDIEDFKKDKAIEKERKEHAELINRWENKISRGERELKELKGRKDFVIHSVSDLEGTKKQMNTLVDSYKDAADKMIRQILPKSKDLKRDLNKKLNNPAIQDEIISNPYVGYLEQGACIEMVKLLNLPKEYPNFVREYSMPAFLGPVMGLMFPDDARKIASKVQREQERNGKMDRNAAEKETSKSAMKVYERNVEGSIDAFQHYFGIKCTVNNVKKVMEILDFKKTFNDRLVNFDRPNEYGTKEEELKKLKLPEVNKSNYKDMTLLLMAGVKTAVKKARVKEEVQHVKAMEPEKGKEAEHVIPNEHIPKKQPVKML